MIEIAFPPKKTFFNHALKPQIALARLNCVFSSSVTFSRCFNSAFLTAIGSKRHVRGKNSVPHKQTCLCFGFLNFL